MTRILVAALLVLGGAAPLAAQAARATPEALAIEIARHSGEQQWQAVAQLTDPAALAHLHDTFGRVLELNPDAAALQMFGVSDHAGYMRLDPRVVMVRLLELGTGGDAFDIGYTSSTLLGVVHEGDDLAHAVVRQDMRFEGRTLSTAELVSMRRAEDGWWAQFGPQMQGMLLGLESQLPPRAQ